MNFIKNILEPNHLFLVWKDNWKDETGKISGTIRIIGNIIRNNGGARLEYLSDTDDFKLAREHGFKCYPAFPDISKTYSTNVLEVFSRRIPPRSREDYNDFLEEIRLPKSVDISDFAFALLGYSEVRLPSDGFAIINPFDNVDSDCEFLTEIAGLRYYSKAVNMLKRKDINISTIVNIEIEENNKFDPNAVKIVFNGEKIGNINRVQAQSFKRWILNNKHISAQVEKINGTDERPSVILFVKIR
ncbi:HIRAN domain-containing protein [bacterium]